MKKIFTLFAALAMVLSMSAEMVYLQPSNNWLEGNAEFWVHSWGGTAEVSGKLENLGLGLYGLDINDNTSCLFVRQESGQSSINWDNNWYKTGDQTIATDKRCYKVINWHEDGTGWVATPSLSGYIAGDGALLGEDWNPEAEANKMTKQEDGTYTLVKTVTLEAKTYGYKVTNGSWDWSLGNGGENATLTIETEGKYSVTFTYTPASEQVTAVATLVTHTVTLLNDAGAELEGAGQYEDGAFVTVSAPEEWDGYIFVSWVDEEGNGVSDNASTDIQVLEDITLTALYAMMMPLEVTDLEIVMDPVVGLMGSTELPMGTLSLQLVVDASAEPGEDGFPLTEDSQIWLGDTQFEFLEGVALIDMENNAAQAIVLAADEFGLYYLVVNMSAAAPAEPTEVVVENATVVIEERSLGFGDATYSVLILTGEWSDGETTYPVSLVTSEFDPEQESQEVAATLTVGGEGDEDPWLGHGEGNATIAIVDNTVSVSGLFENQGTGFAANATISGTLPAEEPDYQVVEDEITNFVFDTEAWPMVCAGGPSTNYGIEVYLVLTEEADGTLNYEQSSVSLMGTAATLIDGTLSNIDVFAPAANAVLRVQWNDGYFELHLTMSAAAAEPEEIDIVNAVATYNEGSGELFLTATWTDSDEVTYPVTINLAGYEYKEESVIYSAPDVCSVQIGGDGEDDPWYTYATAQEVVVTIEDQQIVIEGAEFTSPNGDSYYIMITGTLPGGTTTGLDNINTTVAPVKTIVNGQLVILKDGVQYNAQGAVVK